ncbi:hypothetical protein D3879_03225 [Pseudomonas cavernicola]|uniref:Pyrroloquinoline quinone biosynthesis protein PqqE n=1 Tax=Pseudomonas cavernicola TaxID=2320866 RepID=A0A418XIL1_9PSED|nr:hypothetical protein [Pseudomonas cavernicola]RJG12323.1 hypothetical protein D3879_03225 [Pseudomonas cavernicola]
MQISGNAFSAGLSTLQSGQQRIDQAASGIASNALPRPERAADSSQPAASSVDLASSLTELQVGKVEAQAGAKVIKTADEMLGTLIDTRA